MSRATRSALDHHGGKLKRTVEGMADAPIQIQRQVHPIRKLVMSLWRPPGQDSLARCDGVCGGTVQCTSSRVAMLQNRKEISRDAYLLNIDAISCYGSYLYCDSVPQLI